MNEIIQALIDANSDCTILFGASIVQFLIIKECLYSIEKYEYDRSQDLFINFTVIVLMLIQTFMVCISAWGVMDDVTSGMAWASLFLSFAFMFVSFLKIKSKLVEELKK